MERSRLLFLRIMRTGNVGPQTFHHLLQKFNGDAEAILNFLLYKKFNVPALESIEKEIDKLYAMKGHVLYQDDDFYPKELRKIQDFPPFLFYFGNKDCFQKECIAIVGARNASFQGKKFIQDVAGKIAKNGYVVVSGLARGIDYAAHLGALNNGTIAILAGGIDQIYPREHQKIYDEIKEKGVILSEMPLYTPHASYLFARRNRLIAGISKTLLVCEASLKSGSMITVDYGLKQGKDIFVVPGHPGDYRSRGGNKLIQEGAYLFQDLDDMFVFENKNTEAIDQMTIEHSNSKNVISVLESEILDLLSTTPIMIDDVFENLSQKTSLSHFMVMLSQLEYDGKIIIHPQRTVSKR